MYFIVIILSFLTICLSAVGLTSVVTAPNWHEFVIGISVVSGIATTVSIFCMIFSNMEFRNRISRKINQIRKYTKRIKDKKVDLKRYKDELKKVLTEMYPEYEKDMFSKMAQNDAKQLEIMLVKYPELKFDGILTDYINGVKARLNNINDYESYITGSLEDIQNINDNGWMIKKVTLPSPIQNLID